MAIIIVVISSSIVISFCACGYTVVPFVCWLGTGLQDFAVRATSIYNNPIYSGAHVLLTNPDGGSSSFVQFLATYYR